MATSKAPRVRVLQKKFKRDDNDTVLCTHGVKLEFDGTILDLSQSWKDGEELAPIFSGACWAGTVVWQAALDLCDFMSEHLRRDLVGARVVELGCGIGVPGMVARLLGAAVILTEQDEMLSLLDRNIASNFGGHGDGIRRAALDWGRSSDVDSVLASLNPAEEESEQRLPESNSTSAGGRIPVAGEVGKPTREEFVGDDTLRDDCVDSRAGDGHEGSGRAEVEVEQRWKRPEFIICADCVFEPLYGDSWKALAKVMAALSDSDTTVLCALERRGEDDGVLPFLAACEVEGFALQLVFLAGPDAPAPVKIYELSKGGREGFRCAEVVDG